MTNPDYRPRWGCLTADGPQGRNSRTARFFDLDHPEGGLSEFGVPTQFRVRRGNERDGPEGDERLFTPPMLFAMASRWR